MKTIEEIYGYKSDSEVLRFIESFLSHTCKTENDREVIRHTFRAGYCYYFAVMLKSAFNRGCVCWAAPYGHIVWLDDNGCPYDIEGVCASDVAYFIPVSFLEDHLQGFKHVGDDGSPTSWEDIVKIIRRFEEVNNISPVSLEIYKA